MTELTEGRIREIVREEIAAEMRRQAEAAAAHVSAGMARLNRLSRTPVRGEVTPDRRDVQRAGRGSADEASS
ncbi:hypothetical protein [Nocardia sp. CC201C]|uniref:hypothetical protein n=1 Tax=Nocardia sp. CC201C TaxID=3044575 RepID=UPI0024A912C8|nr:hypothetical protein [Nocardia sp. CC201C]